MKMRFDLKINLVLKSKYKTNSRSRNILYGLLIKRSKNLVSISIGVQCSRYENESISLLSKF